LRKTAAEARAGNLPEGDIHFFALFLLTEFQAKEALPAILDVFSLPGEFPFDLFGDTVTETLVRILADFASDQPDILDKLIEKREVTEFVRAAAAETFLYLVRDGHMSREDAITRLQRHLREAMKSHDERIIGFLIAELYSYAPKEAWGDIEEAYRRNLVDRFIVNEENIKQSISEGESHFQKSLHNCRRTGIKDIIAELEGWASFREEPAKVTLPPKILPPKQPVSRPLNPLSSPLASESRRVGRNDPCPCGSGKKFKKCCGIRR
jgi:uncharacterized protein YecA (UPF0149 family)